MKVLLLILTLVLDGKGPQPRNQVSNPTMHTSGAPREQMMNICDQGTYSSN